MTAPPDAGAAVEARLAELDESNEESDGIDRGPRLNFQVASQVKVTRPEYLWRPWLVRGALHLIIGKQSFGKSTLAAWIASHVSTGRPFPHDDDHRGAERCGQLSLEEGADRIAARLIAAESFMDRIAILGDVTDVDSEGREFRRPWRLPEDCGVLERRIIEERLRLVTVDGLGYSIRGDSHNYAVVGSALSALAGVAERTGATIIGLTHPPKGSSDPLTAAIGSTAWTAIPRVCWVLGVDPDDESTRVVRVSKTNFREPDWGLSFQIGNHEEMDCGYLTGIGTSDVSKEDLVAAAVPPEERGARAEAREFLASLLGSEPMDAAQVKKMAEAAGISYPTLKRAKADLAVCSEPHKDDAGRVKGWMWSLPDQGINPVVQGTLDPLEPLDLTRENTATERPEAHFSEVEPLELLEDSPNGAHPAYEDESQDWREEPF